MWMLFFRLLDPLAVLAFKLLEVGTFRRTQQLTKEFRIIGIFG